MSILLSLLVLSLSVWVAAAILPGIRIKSFWDAVVVSIIFGVVNFLFSTVLFIFIGIVTLGIGFLLYFLTRLFVSALLLKLTDALTHRLEVRSFGWAFAGAAVISITSLAGEHLLGMITG